MQRNPEWRRLRGRELKIARQNANNRDRLAIEANGSANRVRIRTQFRSPERVAQDSDVRTVGLIFRLQKITTKGRLHAQSGKEVRRNLRAKGELRLASDFQRETVSSVARKGLKTLRSVLPIQKIRIGGLGHIDGRGWVAGFTEKE